MRRYLSRSDQDFRRVVLRLIRRTLLSDRILQLCCDLLIPEFISACLESLQSLDPLEPKQDQWNVEERVEALKVIRHWCSIFIAGQTSIPIPICFLRSVVEVGRLKQPLVASNSSSQMPCSLDPIGVFCIATVRDLAIGLDLSTFRRLSEVGGISLIVDAFTAVDLFEIEPGFFRSLVVALSSVFENDDRRLALG